MPDILKQNLAFLFKTDIWKFIFDSKLPLIAVELRDHEAKELQVAIIDYKAPQLPFYLPLALDWWSSISDFDNGRLIIQKFKDDKFPEPKGFICFDIKEGSVKVDEAEYNFSTFDDSSIIINKVGFQDITFESLRIEGQMERKLIERNEAIAKINSIDRNNIAFPLQYLATNIHFNTVRRFIEKYTEQQPVQSFEYLESGTLIIVSYYIRTAEKMLNYILISSNDGQLLMNQVINSDAKGIGKDTFLIKDNQIFFIQDKKEIKSYVL